jgi:hypothetical protein
MDEEKLVRARGFFALGAIAEAAAVAAATWVVIEAEETCSFATSA